MTLRAEGPRPLRVACAVALSTLGILALSCGSSSSPSPPGACVTAPATSAAPAAFQVVSLGRLSVGAAASFAVPAGTASITIVEQALSARADATFTDAGTLANTAVPLRITDPTGAVIFDVFTQPDASADPAATTKLPLLFDSSSPGTGTVTLPNTIRALELVAAGLAPGQWTLEVSDLAFVCSQASNCANGGGSDTGVYDVTVVLKPGDGLASQFPNIPDAGRLDVTFEFAAGPDPTLPTAATAPSDPDVQRLVASLGALLQHAGITLATVQFADVPASMAARIASGLDLSDSTTCGELQQLLATAPPGRQVNVFLVPGFVDGGMAPSGTQVAGVDGTIPGPATLSPSVQSGVAVSLVDLRHGSATTCRSSSFDPSCGADAVAYVTAHELGHFLGLYHVTEQTGTLFDPLQDTPTCPCQQCTSSRSQCADATPAPSTPHTMSQAECTASSTCSGGDNLMFWLFDSRRAIGTLTGEQAAVMRANPAVY